MQRCEDNVAARLNGNALQPLSDVSVTVTDDHTGLPAALYSDNGVTQVFQPLKTDDNGYYGFYAANGEYTLTFSGIRIATFTRKVVLNDFDDNPAVTKAELAAGSGASLVTFAQAGAGAVPRPLQDELRERVSVKQFGAKGDGVTDDTAAIQAALNAAVAVIFPAGTYLHSRLVLKKQGQRLIGAGVGATVLSCPTGYSITNYAGADADPIGSDWIGGFVIEKMTLSGGFVHTDVFAAPTNSWATGTGRNKTFTTTGLNVGLRLKRAIPYTLRDVEIKNFHRGVLARGAAQGSWSNFLVHDCQYGVYVDNGAEWGDSGWKVTTHHLTDGRFTNCWVGLGGGDLVQSQIDKSVVFEACNTAIAVYNGQDNVWSGYFELCSEGLYRNGTFMGADTVIDMFAAGVPGNMWGAGDSILIDAGASANAVLTLRFGQSKIGGGGIRALAGRIAQPEKYQGAMVFITATTPAGGYATRNIPLALAVAADDTSGFFSAGAPTRLTIPANLRGARVRLKAQVSIAGDATANEVSIQIIKNGAAFNGGGLFTEIFSWARVVSVGTAVTTVAAGDYFELQASMNLSRAVNGGLPHAWFALEVLE